MAKIDKRATKTAELPEPARAERFTFEGAYIAPDRRGGAVIDIPPGVVCARAIVHRPDQPLLVLVREGVDGDWGFVGGKVEAGNTAEETAARETLEELGMLKLSGLRPLLSVDSPNRTTVFSKKKWEALGYSAEGWPENGPKIEVPNPLTEYYTLVAKGKLPDEQEGRRVIELELSKEKSLKRIKSSHREIARLWRNHHLEGTSLPRRILDSA